MLTSILHNTILPLNYYLNFIFFNGIHNIFNKKMNVKLANNFTALTHATGCTILASRYLLNKTDQNYNTLTAYSSAYFLYDMIYILKYWKPKTINYAYMYHHFASLFLMHQDPLMYKGAHVLFFGELSNLPGYLVYYFNKKPGKEKIVKKLKWLQFLLYSFIRVPIMTKILKDAFDSSRESKDYTPIVIASPVYLMGLIWTKKLFDKL